MTLYLNVDATRNLTMNLNYFEQTRCMAWNATDYKVIISHSVIDKKEMKMKIAVKTQKELKNQICQKLVDLEKLQSK